MRPDSAKGIDPISTGTVDRLDSDVKDAIAHCSERDAAFKVEKLESFLLDEVGRYSHADIQAEIDRSDELIYLDERVTTFGALHREMETIELMRRGQGQSPPLMSADMAANRLDKIDERLQESGHQLTRGQREAIALVATSPDRVLGWQGVAGAGKTTALT